MLEHNFAISLCKDENSYLLYSTFKNKYIWFPFR